MTMPPARIPVYRCQYTPLFPRPEPLDADALAWSSAAAIHPFRRADGRSDARRQTLAKLLWDDEALHALFVCEDDNIWSPYLNHNDPLFDGEVVELFLDPEDRRTRYFEFEVSPRNVLFAATIENFGGDPPRTRYTCDLDISALASRVEVDGRLKNPGHPDRRWSAYLRIPFRLLGGRSAPVPGERWKANLFRIDRQGPAPGGPEDEFSCWSSPCTEPAAFHVPDAFGVLEFTR
jgi:hypothetical protein